MTSPPALRPAGDRLVSPADAGRLAAAALGRAWPLPGTPPEARIQQTVSSWAVCGSTRLGNGPDCVKALTVVPPPTPQVDCMACVFTRSRPFVRRSLEPLNRLRPARSFAANVSTG